MKSFQQFNEDLEARRQQLAQRQRDNAAAFKERSLAAASAQKERIAAKQDRERLKSEIKKELQTEQHPTMKPSEYNVQVAKQQARWKGSQIRQSHGEMQSKAQSELAAKQRRMKAIMSR
jgi:hypothetical protein